MTSKQSKSRLDMKHGFMKCIIKNQVERDNYDKEVKANWSEKPRSSPGMTGGASRQRKPEVQTYVPPMYRKTSKMDGQVLFDLEYEDQQGQVHTLTLHKDDNVRMVAERFGLEVGLTEPLIAALVLKLREEMSKRQNGKIS